MTVVDLTLKQLEQLGALQPPLGHLAMRLYHQAQSAISAQDEGAYRGVQAKLGETIRTPERQWELWSRNRERGPDGKWRMKRGARWLTNALPWQGPHVVKCAFHIILVKDGAWLADDHQAWWHLGLLGEQLELEWGGRWTPRDSAHFELKGWRQMTESERTRIKARWQGRLRARKPAAGLG